MFQDVDRQVLATPYVSHLRGKELARTRPQQRAARDMMPLQRDATMCFLDIISSLGRVGACSAVWSTTSVLYCVGGSWKIRDEYLGC